MVVVRFIVTEGFAGVKPFQRLAAIGQAYD